MDTQFKTLLFVFVMTTILNCGWALDGNQSQYFYSSCNENYILQEKLSQFVDDIVQQYLQDCYIIYIRKQEPILQTFHGLRDIPTINLNFWHPKAKDVINPSNFGTTQNQIRFQRQCIVYYVSLHGTKTTDIENMGQFFSKPELQFQAPFSYILLNEYTNQVAAKQFISMTELKSYKQRTLANIVSSDSLEPHGSEEIETSSFVFQHFCYYCDDGKPSLFVTGKLYKDSHEVTQFLDVFPDVTKNLQGYRMRISTPPAPPLAITLPSKTNPNEYTIHGMHATILTSVAKHLNFTYVLNRGGFTGTKKPDGTWTGIMGEILYGNADIGINVATTFERNKIVDFSVSVFYAFLVLVSTKPTPFFEWEAIYYPLKGSCWLAVAVSTIVTIFIYRFLHNKSVKLEVPPKMKGKSKYEVKKQIKIESVTTFEAFYFAVGSLLEQGVPFSFNTFPSRLYCIFWMFFAIIVTCAYRSKLFAFLTFPTIEMPPATFTELSKSIYTWGMQSMGGVGLLFIIKSPIPIVRSMGERMEIYTDKYTCLDKTFQTRFTCIIYKATIDYMMEVRFWKLQRKLFVSDFVTPPVGAAWAFQKYSPLRPAFDSIAVRIHEMGLADKYVTDYIKTAAADARLVAQATNSPAEDTFALNTNYVDDSGDGAEPLEMVNLYGGFFVLFFGTAAGVAILIFEIVQSKKYNKNLLLKQLQMYARFRSRVTVFKRTRKGDDSKLKFQQVVRLLLPVTDAAQLNDGKFSI